MVTMKRLTCFRHARFGHWSSRVLLRMSCTMLPWSASGSQVWISGSSSCTMTFSRHGGLTHSLCVVHKETESSNRILVTIVSWTKALTTGWCQSIAPVEPRTAWSVRPTQARPCHASRTWPVRQKSRLPGLVETGQVSSSRTCIHSLSNSSRIWSTGCKRTRSSKGHIQAISQARQCFPASLGKVQLAQLEKPWMLLEGQPRKPSTRLKGSVEEVPKRDMTP
mmetsp:Transcript_63066/g.118033  ORF Transcript_63066/g.118033 Transcript_63066/m.118033 type:complete len:222 (-) Transcript_63066:968-1633(-)